MQTYVPSVKTMPIKWHVIDANGKVLGRIATDAAKLLQGKHKAIYTPYLDTGDHVIVLNVATVMRLYGAFRVELERELRRDDASVQTVGAR